MKFDHEFAGSDALRSKSHLPHRKKLTFAWNGEDLAEIYASLFAPGAEHYKFFDLPISNYASSSYDRVMKGDET